MKLKNIVIIILAAHSLSHAAAPRQSAEEQRATLQSFLDGAKKAAEQGNELKAFQIFREAKQKAEQFKDLDPKEKQQLLNQINQYVVSFRPIQKQPTQPEQKRAGGEKPVQIKKQPTLHGQFMAEMQDQNFGEAETLLKSDDGYAINLAAKVAGKVPVLLYTMRDENADTLAKEIINQAGKRKDRDAIINAKDDKGETALMEAVAKGKEYLPDLLKLNPDVTPQAKDGSTALMLAIVNNNNDLAMHLLDRGASLIVGGRFLGEFARGEGARQRIEAFRDDLTKQLNDAIYKDDIEETIKLARRADINYRHYGLGPSPLIWAVLKMNKEIIQILLKAGANIHARDKYNDQYSTAFVEALSQFRSPAGKENREKILGVIKILIAAGADVNSRVRGIGNRTALIDASALGELDLVKVLLEAGAKVNAVETYYGYTALDAAEKSKGNNSDLIELLKKHGAKHASELEKK